MIKLVFLLFGVFTLSGIIWHIGPNRIFHTIITLGPLPLCVIFLPLVVVYVLETYGWRLTLGPSHAKRVGFFRLFMIRMAGEVINVTTPTGYVGGEPMKAYVLRRYGVPIVEGMASVVTAKTTMTLAQVMFIILGLGMSFWVLRTTEHHLLAVMISLGILSCGLGVFVMIQRYGMAAGLLLLLRTLRIRIAYLEKREAQLLELDESIQQFYVHRRCAFALAVGTFMLAWMTETFEVYAILYFLDVPVDLLSSFSIAALSVLIKGSAFFIPGSLGAQEGGYLLLLLGFGYDEVTGMAFALIRRLREILWIMIGLAFLAVLKGRDPLPSTAP